MPSTDAFEKAKTFIEKCRKRGDSDDAIKKALIDGGWSGEQVEELLASLQPEKASDAGASAALAATLETAGDVSLENDYHSDLYNVSLRYPAGWEILFEDEHEAPWWRIVGIGGPEGPSGRPGFILLVSALLKKEPVDMRSYMDKAESDLRKLFTGLRPISAEERQVHGHPAAWMQYTYVGGPGTIQELNVTLVLGRAGQPKVLVQFVCEALAGDSASLLPTFEAMIHSLDIGAEGLYMPHVEVVGSGSCARCGRAFAESDERSAVFDPVLGGLITVCPRCKQAESGEVAEAETTPSETDAQADDARSEALEAAKAYALEHRGVGESDDAIRRALVQSGWKEEQIAGVFEALGPSEAADEYVSIDISDEPATDTEGDSGDWELVDDAEGEVQDVSEAGQPRYAFDDAQPAEDDSADWELEGDDEADARSWDSGLAGASGKRCPMCGQPLKPGESANMIVDMETGRTTSGVCGDCFMNALKRMAGRGG